VLYKPIIPQTITFVATGIKTGDDDPKKYRKNCENKEMESPP